MVIVVSAVTPGWPSRSPPIARPESYERRDPGRPRAGVTGVGRDERRLDAGVQAVRPVRAVRPLASGRVGPAELVERRVDPAVQPRYDPEQRLVEEREGRAHLVERRRRDASQVGRAPQDRDLLPEAPPQVEILFARRPGVVQLLEQPLHAPQREQERAPPRLGRVGGEDGQDREAVDQCVDLRPVVGLSEDADRLDDRFVEGTACRACPTAERADPLPFLGQVHQLEVQAERTRDGGRLIEIERRELGGQVVTFGVALLRAEHGSATQTDRPPADPFDQLEQLGTHLLGDDLAEQRAEQPDLASERIARGGDARAARLGGDRGERAGSRSGRAAG